MRCLCKKRSNEKLNNFNFKFKPIINEVKSFKPNNKIKILNKGSLNYQLNCQKYNTIPPRHLLPLENILHKNYLIKEKADGILTSVLPNKIIPQINEIFNYQVKAEFIEDLNLYLIFDINIPNMTILERQHFLRSIHPETEKIPYTSYITTFETLINEIKKERNILKNFMENNQNGEFKWYPKGSWKLFMNDNFYIDLINFIEETNEYTDFLLNGEFNCDGLILTPLDGSRELKVKPKKLQTIDLLFNGKKWVDSNNIEWNINMIPNKKYQNKIYRCYPLFDKCNNNYTATEIRFDKKRPNSNIIVDQIKNIYNFKWLENVDLLINKEKYYELVKKLDDNYIINILENQKKLLEKVISDIKPEINKNWIDLGCGKCKLYYLIKDKYIPKNYMGIDNDTSILSKKYHLVDETNNLVNLFPSNLKDIWDKIVLWNNFNWSINYDYILANFSIMHFWSDLFWEQLNKVTKTGSIFIFNIVKENINWNYKDSYIISDNIETKIYFNWAHTKEHKEPIISNASINNMTSKYGWIIINRITFNYPLSNCYEWYILSKE